MSLPDGPEPGQSLESWVRDTLLHDDEAPRAVGDAVGTSSWFEDGWRGSGWSDPAPPLEFPVLAPGPVSVVGVRPGPQRRRRRVMLGTAAAVTGSFAFGIAVAQVPVHSVDPAIIERPGAGPAHRAPSALAPQLAYGRMLAAEALPRAAAPVTVPFGSGRVDVREGWEIGVSRPYPCPVLMTMAALRDGDTRLVRMTVTIRNDTDTTQQVRSWSLAATADGHPAELVLWPTAGFRGVPDRVLAPGERVRFLVAVRLPAQRSEVAVEATRGSAVSAVLTGRV